MTKTKKGLEIAEYIRTHNLSRGGRGWLVMGALVGGDGVAREVMCYASCPKGCTAHPTVVHGHVAGE